jgi:cellulose synthase/poly-beta-1,6-N-acetylglucosamine synthase-like glycosyltransferase
MDALLYGYQYLIFFYAFALVVLYTTLAVLAFSKLRGLMAIKSSDTDKIFRESPFIPGISIIAPAFNEEKSIINNVVSMLTVNYPKFEVVIVNDGSQDDTLKLLIDSFEMVETTYAYVEKIKTKPFKRIFKSTNPEFSRLIVVDKENGGTKADASNAGVNVAKYAYFICTDVDCVLDREALTRMVLPIISTKTRVIAVGATMRMVNSCKVENGVMVETRLPSRILPLYQEIEYLRSYFIGKLGFSTFNAVHNVSGGLGLFDTEIAIGAGGYDPLSHAEDMDMTTRMIAYMINYQKPYRIEQVPDTCCWTEGPPTFRVLNRQRTRWARGLFQIFSIHRKYLFNRKFKKMGLITYPYIFIFEFLAPIIEMIGYLATIYLVVVGGINWGNAAIMLFFVYIFGVSLSLTTILYERLLEHRFNNSEYLRLILFCLIEPFIYHPLIVFFNIRGYIDFLTKKDFEWGTMTREGLDDDSPKELVSAQSLKK